MYEDKRQAAAGRAMAVAGAYERARGAAVTDVHQGYDPRLRMALEGLGIIPPPAASADLISVLGDDTRIIEVKAEDREVR